ncbi:MAG TPA: hypothetical protein VNU19_13605 [Candidatus Acidoferrum sp.]|jgi:hypothetical protein|nr:hypothetical protein [Candidatus Acidoferrum sp.]
MNEQTTPAGVPEHLNPVQLPGRFWSLIDAGLLSLEAAQAEWGRQRAEGVKE